jgi:hypothetical protein
VCPGAVRGWLLRGLALFNDATERHRRPG